MVENMMKIMGEGLLILNPNNEVEIVNESIMSMLGFSTSGELVGKHVSEFYAHADEAASFIEFFEINDRFDNRESKLVRKSGSTFTVSYSGLHIQHASRPGVFKAILLRDITAQKTAERRLAEYTERLEKSNKELDQFAYIVSHDLKAPLRAISNLSLWLQEDLGPSLSEENKKNLVMLRGRVVRLDSLISGILEYSKVGRTQLVVSSIDVHSLITEVVEMLSPPAHINIQIGNKMPVVDAPKILLLQVFSNLIGNAIKYNDKAQGLINIYCEQKETCYEFVVEDNGPGIPAEFFEQIFVIFHTLKSRDKFESTGIGLTIVKRIIEEQGGKIWVESEIGTGSKFIFTWPKQTGKQNTTIIN
jgi:PAS domain S-box-containing protein